ncbi:macro domain-like protein [Schizophyllum commune Tattone D]|nr:macro domain-like protein [Schizophyllum commune Tattone D]
MDGGYDLALSLMFKGKEGEKTLTRHCQAALREKWAGYLPPSSCMLMPIPAEVENPLKAKVLAVLPTMRIPEDASWNRDLVYNSMWALLNAIRTHGAPLESVLLTGLGTGTGYVSPKRCAAQMMLAVKHFVEGIPENGTWNDVMPVALEVDKTFKL